MNCSNHQGGCCGGCGCFAVLGLLFLMMLAVAK